MLQKWFPLERAKPQEKKTQAKQPKEVRRRK
jgi:hypothetical protein